MLNRRLWHAMLESGVTQRELARRAGVSQPRISAVLHGLGFFSGKAAARVKHALRNQVDLVDLVRIPEPRSTPRKRRRSAQ
jgi:transcriptional regulator with XRE-family HTH domain